MGTAVLVIMTAGGVYLCARMAGPFLSAMVWALTLAVLFVPWQRWFESRLRHPGGAALICVLVIGVIVVVPTTFVAQQLVAKGAKGATYFEGQFNSGDWRQAINVPPNVAHLADTIKQHVDLSALVKSLAMWLSTAAGSRLKGSVYQLVALALTFYLLFFFLRDRRAMLQSLRSLCPLPDGAVDRLFRQVEDTIHATVYGTLMVSLLQGILGGLMFWWVGLPMALFWGGVMALLAIIPVLGAFVVWIPAAIYLGSVGEWGKALTLSVWGLLVVGTIDNLLRPMLVGNRLKQHTVLVFMSVVGGLVVFGATGLILGPVTLTVTLSLLEYWRHGGSGPVRSRRRVP